MNTFREENGKLICALEERLDTISSQSLEWEMDMRIKSQHNEVVFDLDKVEFVSSTFLRLCLKLAKILGKEKFSLMNVSPTVMKVFQIANLTELCRIA
ncbi:MAG TPA: STAS domain-containing protein [Bacteroidales bacterium]|nr:STAS domain-containing protein [Bacteroidales bacterium]HSA44012.1 STAS domain-containing protein [Bacteroidales bacterium]